MTFKKRQMIDKSKHLYTEELELYQQIQRAPWGTRNSRLAIMIERLEGEIERLASLLHDKSMNTNSHLGYKYQRALEKALNLPEDREKHTPEWAGLVVAELLEIKKENAAKEDLKELPDLRTDGQKCYEVAHPVGSRSIPWKLLNDKEKQRWEIIAAKWKAATK